MSGKLFLGFINGDLAELLEVLHEVEGGLAGAGAGCFVALYDLSFCIRYEFSDFSIDLFDELFHNSVLY